MTHAEVKVTIVDLPAVKAIVEQLKSVVRDIADPDDCSYDHHGYCQTHGWMDTEPSCPHARAKQLLSEPDGSETP